MLSRLISLLLTLYLIGVSINVIRQSHALARLRDQVAEMERSLGSAEPPDENRMWLKLVEAEADRFAWRLYVPPIKAFTLAQATVQPDGTLRFGASSSVGSSKAFRQQSMIRISRAELQGKTSYFVSLFDSQSQGTVYATLPGSNEPLPLDAIEFTPFATDSDAILELDTPVPLLSYRAKEEFVQSKLQDGTIDSKQADQLRLTHVWYFGTPNGMKKIGYGLIGPGSGAH